MAWILSDPLYVFFGWLTVCLAFSDWLTVCLTYSDWQAASLSGLFWLADSLSGLFSNWLPGGLASFDCLTVCMASFWLADCFWPLLISWQSVWLFSDWLTVCVASIDWLTVCLASKEPQKIKLQKHLLDPIQLYKATLNFCHRRRINTEEKAKAAAWGTKLVKFQAIL